jgi:phosphate-selective porin
VNFGSTLKVEFTARAESDERMATPTVGIDRAVFAWQTPRVGVQGTLAKNVQFEMSRDLGDKAVWKDAYVDIRVARALQVEGGRFKIPFGRDTLRGRPNLDFVYRSLAASELSSGRDAGVMAHGRLFGRLLAYQAGYFAGDGDNARTTHTRGARDMFAGRVVLTPFSGTSTKALAPLQIGIAAGGSRLDNQLGLRGQSVFGDGVFFDRVYVNGRRRRTGFEAFWARGPASFSTEYIAVSDDRKSMGFSGEDLPRVRTSGWYVAATWAVTGEQKDGWVEPRRALLRGGPGAFELVARTESLAFGTITSPGTPFGFPDDSSLLSNADHVTTLGVNWYADHYIRIQTNVVFESITDAQRSPAPTGRGRFVSVVVRLQFVL